MEYPKKVLRGLPSKTRTFEIGVRRSTDAPFCSLVKQTNVSTYQTFIDNTIWNETSASQQFT